MTEREREDPPEIALAATVTWTEKGEREYRDVRVRHRATARIDPRLHDDKEERS